MRITKNQLRQIIKEELAAVLHEETWLQSDPPQLVPEPDYGQEGLPPIGSEGDITPGPWPGHQPDPGHSPMPMPGGGLGYDPGPPGSRPKPGPMPIPTPEDVTTRPLPGYVPGPPGSRPKPGPQPIPTPKDVTTRPLFPPAKTKPMQENRRRKTRKK